MPIGKILKQSNRKIPYTNKTLRVNELAINIKVVQIEN